MMIARTRSLRMKKSPIMPLAASPPMSSVAELAPVIVPANATCGSPVGAGMDGSTEASVIAGSQVATDESVPPPASGGGPESLSGPPHLQPAGAARRRSANAPILDV
jgi:hypothetical protein